MKIMTGKTGAPHVTSQQFRQLVEGTVGQDSYILTSGENLEPELQTNNLLKIRSGMMSHHGNLSVVELGTYDEVTIQNGTQGMQRIDLVVNRYTRNEETGIEDNEWIVIMGTPAASDPVAPAYTEGNLQDGDLVDDCPVFEVHLDGINVTEVVKLLDVTSDMSTLNASLSELRDNNYELGSDIASDHSIWYKKYANGLIEYWGRSNSPSSGAGGRGFATIDFPIPFKSTNDYIVTAAAEYAGSSTITFETSIQRTSASRAYIYTRTNTGSVTGAWVEWSAKGFWK